VAVSVDGWSLVGVFCVSNPDAFPNTIEVPAEVKGLSSWLALVATLADMVYPPAPGVDAGITLGAVSPRQHFHDVGRLLLDVAIHADQKVT